VRATAAALGLLLGGCAVMVEQPEPPGANWVLPGTEWRLVELNGAPFPARATATLTEDGRITGQAPCNRFAATWSGRWPDLTFQPAAATRMACPELEAEAAFFQALEAVNHAEVGDTGLILTGPEGVRMRFQRIS
jgi:heat shock protein HslJ